MVLVSLVAELMLRSCGDRAQLPHSMWNPPRPGIEPVSPALAGGFPTSREVQEAILFLHSKVLAKELTKMESPEVKKF